MVAGVFCNRLYALHADNWKKGKSRDLSSRRSFGIRHQRLNERRVAISEVEDQRCHCDSESFRRRCKLM